MSGSFPHSDTASGTPSLGRPSPGAFAGLTTPVIVAWLRCGVAVLQNRGGLSSATLEQIGGALEDLAVESDVDAAEAQYVDAGSVA